MAVDRSLKILLVEDSKVVRKMAAKALTELGFQNILQAEDGNDAISKLQVEEGVGLIISDWNMPNKDGFELLQWVRANSKCAKIPFIMATARGERKQVTAATEAGVSNFITKPFGPPELNELINETLGGKSVAQAAPGQEVRVPQVNSAGKLILEMAHIQITDHLTLGVLKHLIDTGKVTPEHFIIETKRMPSWNALQQALEKGKVDGAFALAPIAMDLFGFGVPIKLVMFAHRNGSIAVRNSKAKNMPLKEAFLGKTFYIPHELSIHHMLAHRFLKELGLKPGFAGRGECDVFFEVVPPIKMPELLASNPDACGFLVAEPMGTKAIAEGSADLLFLSGEMWETHPCCVVTLREEVIQKYPEAVQEFSDLLVVAGRFISEKVDAAAEVAVQFLDPDGTLKLKVPILKNVLREAQGIKTNDLFPSKPDLDRIQQYMNREMGMGSIINLDSFVDERFARQSCKEFVSKTTAMHDPAEVVDRIVQRQSSGVVSKSNLNIEGSYLVFSLSGREYGIDILWIKEIITMPLIRSLPHAPFSVCGIMNFRGQTIPVIDLRVKLGLYTKPADTLTRIIVLSKRGGGKVIGMMVDAVSRVVPITSDHIADAGAYKQKPQTDYILAFAKVGDGVKILLDTERLFKY
ncbi:two-component system, chemotaxis family, chemotaxis protein CheY [Gammaproteobacteria bacterium]